jgi:hypothetical protein
VSEFADSHDSNIPAHLYSQPSEVVSYIPEGAAEIVPEDIDEMPEDVRTAVGDTLDITATDDEFEEAASPLPGRELTEGDAGVHQRFDGPTISEHLPVPEMHLPQAVGRLSLLHESAQRGDRQLPDEPNRVSQLSAWRGYRHTVPSL